MKPAFAAIILCALNAIAAAQEKRDTVSLKEAIVKAYFSDQPILRSAASASIIDEAQISHHSDASLVPAINTVPGVRMEERSPGSYRLSIRGSLLRSPFGIRNVKIYLDGFPLTDAGGNTYLNLLDAGNVNRIEILKGPEASVFGANSGGVILINRELTRSASVSGSISAGSYGLFHQQATAQKQADKYGFSLSEGYQRSDGYRENSALQRKYAILNQQFQYSHKGQLKSVLLYSDLHYQTPGGLTAAQAELDPKSARPAAGNIPGAIEQRAGIYNKTIFAGLRNETMFSQKLRYIASIFGSHTSFQNPFITNYEDREEHSIGIRTFTELKGGTERLNWQWATGLEAGHTASAISNYNNSLGNKSALQSADKLVAEQDFLFSHLALSICQRLFAEVATSLNFYDYRYRSISPIEIAERTKRFKASLMPRIAASYKLTSSFALRASASRGYSAPTIAEVRASDNVINTSLQPENGWNYETGLRFESRNNRYSFDLAVFNFRLKGAIVRRLNSNDTEYFINAGGTVQKGMEWQCMGWLIQPTNAGLIRGFQFRNSYTRSSFIFSDYMNAGSDHSGNRLTGVPESTLSSSFFIRLPHALSLFAQHSYTSKIPLNDANSIYSKSYDLLSAKASWKSKRGVEISAGADNLLDTEYSLGNDLNAVGNRFFNPAPGRNYFAGISITLSKSPDTGSK